ncbi:MAG: hypothetical protein PHO79_03040, partial [Desulfoplanes sp.]|nr:hypothetical protein [Desulfoplanes sp.]
MRQNMNSIQTFLNRLLPPFWRETDPRKDAQSLFSYRRGWWWVILCTPTGFILPLLILRGMNPNQYQEAMQTDMAYPAYRLVSNVKRSISFFLEERRSALTFLVEDNSFEQLTDQRH